MCADNEVAKIPIAKSSDLVLDDEYATGVYVTLHGFPVALYRTCMYIHNCTMHAAPIPLEYTDIAAYTGLVCLALLPKRKHYLRS